MKELLKTNKICVIITIHLKPSKLCITIILKDQEEKYKKCIEQALIFFFRHVIKKKIDLPINHEIFFLNNDLLSGSISTIY